MTQPKKKLYLATVPSFTVMFLADEECKDKSARVFAREEWEVNGHRLLCSEVQEITSEQEVPAEWSKYALLWGTNDEITALDFLNGLLDKKDEDEEEEDIDPEWEEYKRLKKKFGA